MKRSCTIQHKEQREEGNQPFFSFSILGRGTALFLFEETGKVERIIISDRSGNIVDYKVSVNGGGGFWGHCTSQDLLHWQYQDPVLTTDRPEDRSECIPTQH